MSKLQAVEGIATLRCGDTLVRRTAQVWLADGRLSVDWPAKAAELLYLQLAGVRVAIQAHATQYLGPAALAAIHAAVS